MKMFFFVHLFNDFSGSPRVLRDAIEALKEEQDSDITVISSDSSGFLNDLGRYYSVPYRPHRSKYFQLMRYVISQVRTFLLLSFLLISARWKKNDTIVLVNTLLPFGAILAASLFSHKTISYIHETHIKPRLLMLFLTMIVNRCADEVIYVSHYVRRALALKRPINHVVYNGLRSDFNVPKLNFEIKFKERTILFVGSPKSYKGIYTFVSLAKRLPMMKFIALLNASERDFDEFCSYVGNISNFSSYRTPKDIDTFFAGAFMVVNLSDPKQSIETFGLTLLEGISFGTPVIAPPHGGPVELLTEEVGYLIEPSNLDEISTYITKLSQDFERWQTLSHNCVQRATLFSSDNYKKNIINVINPS